MRSAAASLKSKAKKQPDKAATKPAGGSLLIHHSKMRVRNAEGKYLTLQQGEWTFCFDCSKAVVFDYLGEETRAQLSLIARTEDLPLELVPVEPKDFLERCDRCQQLAAPSDICFDGRRFLCRRCNNWRD